jgi:predicted nucleic acid-binding protein
VKLFDTNVLVYARGKAHPYRDGCIDLLRAAEGDPGLFAIDVELLQEILDLYTRRGRRAFAARFVAETLRAFSDPFPVTRREIEEATDIVRSYRRVTPRDAIHAAVVITYDLEGIVSADRALDQIDEITRFDPRSLAAEL